MMNFNKANSEECKYDCMNLDRRRKNVLDHQGSSTLTPYCRFCNCFGFVFVDLPFFCSLLWWLDDYL